MLITNGRRAQVPGRPAQGAAGSNSHKNPWVFSTVVAAAQQSCAGGVHAVEQPRPEQPAVLQAVGHGGTYFRDPDGHLMEILTPAG